MPEEEKLSASKRIVLFTHQDCSYCRDAEKDAEKIAYKYKVPLSIIPASQVFREEVEIPITCVMNDSKKQFQLTCFVGYNKKEYEKKLREMLSK